MSNKEDSVDFKKLKHRFNPPKRENLYIMPTVKLI